MFKKLVANLPFSPSLIEQIGFYSERLKKERSVRRLSFLFIALTMMVQIFAVAVPPERSLAASSNHIINGLRTKNDILSAWDAPGSDVSSIYEKLGVSRADIVALPTSPNSTIKSSDADYWSIGRNSLRGYSGVDEHYKNSEVIIHYQGQKTQSKDDDRYIYQRLLRAWDVNNPYNTYKAFRGTMTSTGQPFWILVDCGNLTTIGPYSPPPPPPPPTPKPPTPPKPVPPKPITPQITIRKTIVDKPKHLNPGDTYKYRIEYRNTVRDSLAKNVVIEDQFDTKHFDIIHPKDLKLSNGFLKYDVGGLPFTPDYKVLTITVRVKDQVSSGTNICNTARITSSNTAAKTSKKVCIGVIVKCPYDKKIENENNPACVEPKLVCSIVDSKVDLATRKVTFMTSVTSSNPRTTTIKSYNYDFGDGVKENFQSDQYEHTTMHTYVPGEFEAQVTIVFRTVGQEETLDKEIDCSTPIEFEADEPLGQTKAVKNITQDKEGDAAISSIVNANDELEYTLTVINSQGYERTDIDVSDYIGDILDYATLDEEFLKEQEGSFDKESNKINWEGITLSANSSKDLKFRVKIKDPIPTTNSPSTVSTDFDCKISNQYGNEITMNINCPLVKGIETLPNTGPGTNIAMTVGATTVVGYFFARSRLLAKEISIIRKDYAVTGGM